MFASRPKFIDVERPGPRFDVCELKYDGIWIELHLGRDEAVGYARSGRQRLAGTIQEPVGRLVLIGEYLTGTAWAKAHEQHGDVYVFDVLVIDGQDLRALPLAERRRRLEALFVERPLPGWLHLVEQWPVAKWRALWKRYVKPGRIEGLVFKDSGSAFGELWARKKRETTAEYVCVGFNVADSGRYAGQVRSIQGALEPGGRPVVNVGGLTDQDRELLTLAGDEYVGRMFEASGRGVFESGSLRHPSFERWRGEEHASADCDDREMRRVLEAPTL